MTADKRITKIQEFIYELKVNQVMADKVISVGPQTDMKSLGELLRSKSISGAPVVEDEKLVGLISLEDFINWLADGQKICTIADNTFMSPYLQRPLDLGVDIVVHSTTKYINGHSDIVGGAIVAKSMEHAKRIAFLCGSGPKLAGSKANQPNHEIVTRNRPRFRFQRRVVPDTMPLTSTSRRRGLSGHRGTTSSAAVGEERSRIR